MMRAASFWTDDPKPEIGGNVSTGLPDEEIMFKNPQERPKRAFI